MVKDLINGFNKFRNKYFDENREFYQTLIKMGQKPKVMVISCSDSRVDPTILFGSSPGDLFVVRNVANLVPPYQPDDKYHGVSAAIEYGALELEVRDIIILGHSFCGGIEALCSHFLGETDHISEFVSSWIKIALPAMEKFDRNSTKSEIIDLAGHASINNSIKNLRTFPWVKTRELNKELRIHGWWFDMEEGILWASENGTENFQRLLS